MIPVPFKPRILDESDTSHIDKIYLNEKAVDSPVMNRLTHSQRAKVYFDQFTYSRENEFLMSTQES